LEHDLKRAAVIKEELNKYGVILKENIEIDDKKYNAYFGL